MRHILNWGHRSYLLPPGTKIEQLMKALGEMVEMEEIFASELKGRRRQGDYRSAYRLHHDPLRSDLSIQPVSDDQIVQPPKRIPEERRLPAPPAQLPWKSIDLETGTMEGGR